MMRISSIRLLALALVLLSAALPMALRAQGNLSTQGFGYPTGQLSTRALGAGGAIGEIDPVSATNPASIAGISTSLLYFQAEPEYRTLRVGNLSERTTIARYPLVTAAVPVTQSLVLGLSLSNLLDRSFQTRSRGTQRLGDSTLTTTNVFKSDGAIADVRLGLGWAPRSWLRLGIAAHAITGDNRLNNTQTFDDSTRFARLIDTTTVGYTGNAFSGGIELLAAGVGAVTASYRRGGPLSLKRGDTTVANANVPDHMSFSAVFLGLRSTSIGIRTSKDSWSRMASLGSTRLNITDAWDSSIGADVPGPRLFSQALQLRVGARTRTLPFGLPTSSVKENSYSFGAGTLMSNGRAALDVAGIHASRDAGAGASETAWTLSIGITVRP